MRPFLSIWLHDFLFFFPVLPCSVKKIKQTIYNTRKNSKNCRICIENRFKIAIIQGSFLQFFLLYSIKITFFYSEITVETRTQLKSVIFTTDIFAALSMELTTVEPNILRQPLQFPNVFLHGLSLLEFCHICPLDSFQQHFQ